MGIFDLLTAAASATTAIERPSSYNAVVAAVTAGGLLAVILILLLVFVIVKNRRRIHEANEYTEFYKNAMQAFLDAGKSMAFLKDENFNYLMVNHIFEKRYNRTRAEIIGRVSADCAALTGLSTETLVVSGGGDAQLGCVGVGAVADGQAAVLGGSFWQYEFNTAVPVMDPKCRVRVNCHAVPGVFQYEAIAFFPGLVMRWFRDAFCQEEKRVEAEGGPDAYMQLAEGASKIPAGSHGMMCAFSDVMNYIAWKHAAPTFSNFSLDAEKFNKYTFFRSLMENAALVTRGHLQLVEEVTGRRPEGIVFANGASKSPVWSQIMADVLGLTVRVPEVKEATALGAALCAGVAAGVYDNMEDAVRRTVRWDASYEPVTENRKVYDDLYDKWRAMYGAQLKLADEGVTAHMWRAPGV